MRVKKLFKYFDVIGYDKVVFNSSHFNTIYLTLDDLMRHDIHYYLRNEFSFLANKHVSCVFFDNKTLIIFVN